MAHIRTGSSVTLLPIREFLGLNENPDGDTRIKNGELSELRNFRITRDKHLQLRPGTRTVLSLRAAWDTWAQTHAPTVSTPRLCGVWTGTVGTGEHLLCAFGGVIFDVSADFTAAAAVGTCTQDRTSFFGFGGRVYLLNGHEYMSWDGTAGTAFTAVEGYVPIVMTACTPAGSGTPLENVNRLTGRRRVQFSPDGTQAVFHLPEQDIDEVVSAAGTELTYTSDCAAGTLTFSAPPAAGTNTLTVTYRKGSGTRSEVERMHWSELFNGANDTRVFLYGDGSSRTLYSGLDETGTPSADYFPDLYEAAVGESNTALTALVRHYARLIAFKRGSAWSIQYGTVTPERGAVTAAFFVSPLNRQIGNEAAGQVKLLENDPLTLDAGSIYRWKSSSSGGGLTDNRTNAQRISERVSSAMKGLDPAQTVTFDRRSEHEFWLLCGGTALILNYASDAWYCYTGLAFTAMLEHGGETYGFTGDGDIRRLSREYRNDDGTPISAYAATGLMDFGQDWQTKYAPQLFVAIKPESNARVCVTVESNRRSDYPQRVVAMNLATFTHADFGHWSFRTNHKAQVKRLKLRVKQATFYRLVFSSVSASATATVLEADIHFKKGAGVLF